MWLAEELFDISRTIKKAHWVDTIWWCSVFVISGLCGGGAVGERKNLVIKLRIEPGCCCWCDAWRWFGWPPPECSTTSRSLLSSRPCQMMFSSPVKSRSFSSRTKQRSELVKGFKKNFGGIKFHLCICFFRLKLLPAPKECTAVLFLLSARLNHSCLRPSFLRFPLDPAALTRHPK